MTSNSVSNVLQSLTLAKGQKSAGSAQSGAEFGLLLGNQTVVGVNTSTDSVFMQNNTAEQLQQSYEKGQTESNYKDLAQISDSQSRDMEVAQYEEPYEELEAAVKDVLMEKLNVTEEELLQAMEVLGITFGDLLQGNGLTDLMLQLTGGENMTELLFDANIQELIHEVGVLVSQFADQMDLTPEELELVMQQLNEKAEASGEVIQPQEDVAENAVDVIQTENTSDQGNVKVVKEEAVLSQQQEDGVAVSESSQLAEQYDNSQSDMAQTEEFSEQNDSSLEEMKQSSSRQEIGTQNDTVQAQQVTYQTVQTTTSALGEEVVQVVEQTFVDVEDIMNQITEFTRVTISETQSSLEMQLNPEHLGKIYLQISSKDGVITAQLSAQNEAVRQAMENQVSVLKENLNQQGLKVEAVEVTIASHEFEQNLESNQQQMEEQQENSSQKSRRFLTTETLDEMAESVPEEESLAARIMRENGNSMDVTA